MLVVNLDSLDQASDDLAPRVPVGFLQAVANLLGEALQVSQDLLQVGTLRAALSHLRCCLSPAGAKRRQSITITLE